MAQPAPVAADAPAAPALQVEAVRSDWDARRPPAEGWEPVRLPDNWDTRWPGFDGVTWYRLRWQEPQGGAPVARGLRLDYVSLAGAFYVNGYEIDRDPRLTEPLSRSWNVPRYWRLAPPLLRPGANEVWIRVSGLAAFQPGLGVVRLGPPAAMLADLQRHEAWSRSVHWVGLGLALVLGIVFGMLWLWHRGETAYGWFSAFNLCWTPYEYNLVARSPWPFDGTGAFQAANLLLLVASIGSFGMFALELAGLRARAARLVLAAAVAAGAVLVLATPPTWQAWGRGATVTLCLLIYLCGCAVVVRHAWRTRQVDVAVLAGSLLLPLLAGTHDTLVFLQLIASDTYYGGPSAMASLLGSSFALAWRIGQGMRLIETFNVELQQRVAQARRQLAETLAGQHAAALEQTRLAERMNMVRDLHDGLGMTLSGHMVALREGGGVEAGPNTALAALQDVNDDLRLIIESSSLDGIDTLPERLAPVRHRATRLLEAADIDVRWRLEGLEDLRLEARRLLDFLRVLQEALANVLKHSGARQVQVRIAVDDGQLHLSVRDDGRGLPEAGSGPAQATGIGLRSMHTRAARLRGALAIQSDAQGTRVELRCPLETAHGGNASPSDRSPSRGGVESRPVGA